jgi:hypothetical protein
VGAIWQVRDVTWVQLLTIPGVLLFGNLFEYFLHKGPLHKPYPGVRKVFDIHSGSHHRYYTHQAMLLADHKDVHMVLFPWWAPALIVVVMPILGAQGVGFIGRMTGYEVSTNVTWLAIATASFNFFLYEALHFTFHIPPNPFTDWVPGMGFLRRHHTIHHDPVVMGRVNFNVVCPLSDWLFGTLKK